MAREQWRTLGIRDQLYRRVQDSAVPKHAVSVQAFADKWIRIGLAIDLSMADLDPDDLLKRLLDVSDELRDE